MELLIHIGLNKAGSTYIQDLLSFNVNELYEYNVFYPYPSMTSNKGNAYSGNAYPLAIYLKEHKRCKVKSFLKKIILTAYKKKCYKILLSNESLYHQLIKKEKSALLKEVCDELGVKKIKLLIVFRNPVTHAVSAYNHRVGLYALPSFEQWIEKGTMVDEEDINGINGYEFFSEIKLFQKKLLNDSYDLVLVSLKKNIITVVSDFCGVSLKGFNRDESNVSMNCIESEIVRIISEKNLIIAKKLRDKFKILPKEKKMTDIYLRNKYEDIVICALEIIEPQMKKMRLILSDDCFGLKDANAFSMKEDYDSAENIWISKSQLLVIYEVMSEPFNMHYLKKSFVDIMISLIPKSTKLKIASMIRRFSAS